MGLLDRWRRQRPPADARRDFVPGEHVAAWAPHERGYVIATNLGLWLPGLPDRLGWHQVHKATWSGRALTIVAARPVAAAGSGPDAPVDVVADAEPLTFPLPEPGEVPHQVHVRVDRSVARSTYHELPNGGVRVLSRRVPGVDGLTLQLRYDPGTVLAAADHQLVADLVAEAREAAAL
jgi:hypothetical protein